VWNIEGIIYECDHNITKLRNEGRLVYNIAGDYIYECYYNVAKLRSEGRLSWIQILRYIEVIARVTLIKIPDIFLILISICLLFLF
jgi:hypothetical protein